MSDGILAEERYIRVKRCRHGLFMYNANDQYVGRSLDHYGEFSEGESELFCQLIKPGMTVLDIGANIGAHTVLLAKLVGPEGQAIAFEAQRVLHQLLCGNVALNALDNVIAPFVALGREAGTIVVPPVNYAVSCNFGGISLGQFPAGEVVNMAALDSFNIRRCDFMKIDVEGMEQEVLEGAARTLAAYRPVLYIENDRPQKSQALIEHILRQGYRLYWHLPPLFNPQNYFGRKENVFPGLVSINMIGIPQSGGTVVMQNFAEITAANAGQPPPGLP